ncbi:MAG: helix-turn-helix domain-containing protein [Bacteroidota bacterium]
MTQQKLIEKHLLERGTITTFEAFKEYGITCLNKMIQLLRKKYDITSNWTKANNKNFVTYELRRTK